MNIATTKYSSFVQNNGGRVLLLFLLFLLAIYQFINAGFNAFAIVCAIPLIALVVIFTFKYPLIPFWALIFINYFIMWRGKPELPIPTSLPNELLEIVLIALALIDVKYARFERCANIMLYSLLIWCGFCILEVLNDTCGIGINVGSWYTISRSLALFLGAK